MNLRFVIAWFWRPASWLYWSMVAFLLVAAMLYFYYLFPYQGIGPAQPIPFSHRVHAGVKGIDCRFCHPFVTRSARAGIPAMEKCFFCHTYIIPLHPQLVKEKEYLDRGRPVEWIRVYSLPDHVKFRHSPHIKLAKLDCAACHGQVATMDRLKTVKFQMKFCIDCHRRMQGPMDCWLSCHH